MLDKVIDILQCLVLIALSYDSLLKHQQLKSHFRMIDEAYKHIIIIKNKLGLPLFLEKGESKND